MIAIQDIMNRNVVTVRPETSLVEAVEILAERHVGGAPVVDVCGNLVGMISEVQLIDVVFDLDARTAPVSSCMTQRVHTIEPRDPLSRAAKLFALFSFRRLPVVENGRLVGIVTRRDLMTHAIRSGELLSEPLVELIPSLAQIS